MDRSAVRVTDVSALAELSEAFGSKASEVSLAVLVIAPSFCGRTLTSTVAPWPFAIVPSAQVTVPLDCEQLPCEGVAESNVTPAGRLSVTCTLAALEGPALCAVSVYVSCWPACTGSGASAFVSERSAAGPTVVVALAELSCGLGSKTLENTFAVLVSWSSPCGRTLTSTVPLDCEQLPC